MNRPQYRIIAYLLSVLCSFTFSSFSIFLHIFTLNVFQPTDKQYWQDIPLPFYYFHMSFSFTVSCHGQKCLVSGLCGTLVLNEVLQYVCFPTLIGSCVAFVIPCITVSLPSLAKGDVTGRHNNARGRFTYSLTQWQI